MSLTYFSKPRMLPVFRNDERQPDEVCDGCRALRYFYDGRQNRAVIQPVRFGRTLEECHEYGNQVPVGQPYTIGVFDSQYGPF